MYQNINTTTKSSPAKLHNSPSYYTIRKQSMPEKHSWPRKRQQAKSIVKKVRIDKKVLMSIKNYIKGMNKPTDQEFHRHKEFSLSQEFPQTTQQAPPHK